jgi:hypothetical protein
MRNESEPQLVCAEYHALLKNSQVALTNWNNGMVEIHNSGRRSRGVDIDLRNLQANFAKAWALFQHHEKACEVCHIASEMEVEGSNPGLVQGNSTSCATASILSR